MSSKRMATKDGEDGITMEETFIRLIEKDG